MHSSYQSKFIKLTLVLIIGSSLMGLFSKQSKNIGGVKITPQIGHLYYKLHKNQRDAEMHLIHDLLFRAKYQKLGMSLSRDLIIQQAKQSKFDAKLSNPEKILFTEHQMINQQIINAIKSSVIVTDKMAYDYAKGLLQIRDGKKAIVKYNDFPITVSEEQLHKHYDTKQFVSDRVVKAQMLVINSKKTSKSNLNNAIQNGAHMRSLQEKYDGKIKDIYWTNSKASKVEYSFLQNEPNQSTIYDSSDGNLIYVQIQNISTSKKLSYKEAKPKVKKDLVNKLQKEHIVTNIDKIAQQQKWTELNQKDLSSISQDTVTLFLTALNKVNFYTNDTSDEVTIITTTKITDKEPNLDQISQSKKMLQKHLFDLSYNSFINALYVSYGGIQ